VVLKLFKDFSRRRPHNEWRLLFIWPYARFDDLHKELISYIGLHEWMYSAKCGWKGLITVLNRCWEDDFERIALWSDGSRLVLCFRVKHLSEIENGHERPAHRHSVLGYGGLRDAIELEAR